MSGRTGLIIGGVAVVVIAAGAAYYFSTQQKGTGGPAATGAGDSQVATRSIAISNTPKAGFEDKIKALAAKAPAPDMLKYGAVKGLEGGEGVLENVTVTGPDGKPLMVDKLAIYQWDSAQEVPNRLHVVAQGVKPQLDADAQKQLSEMGYANPEFAFEVDYNFDPQTGGFDLSKLALGMKDGGQLTANLKLLGVPAPNSMQNLGPAAMGQLMAISIGSFELRYEDRGLVEKAMAAGAKEQGKTVEQMKQEAMGGLDQAAAMAQSETGKQAVAELKKFVTNPKGISISLKPAQPFPVAGFMQAQSGPAGVENVLKTLNAKVVAE